MNTSKVQCSMCKRGMKRFDTLILQTPKGRFRLCRNCYAEYSQRQLNKDYKDAKGNIDLFNINFTDAYEVMKNKEEFIKKIKGGWSGRP